MPILVYIRDNFLINLLVPIFIKYFFLLRGFIVKLGRAILRKCFGNAGIRRKK